MLYLLRADQPFRGSIQSHLCDDGTVAYSDGMTPDRYAADRGFPVRVIDDKELDLLIEQHSANLITEPVEETYEEFDYALNCLPPSRWKRVRGVEMFHICELLTLDLATWHASLNGRYFTFTDHADADMEKLAAKVAAAQ